MTASRPSRLSCLPRHPAAALLILCLLLAPSMGWTPARLSAEANAEAGLNPATASPIPSCCNPEQSCARTAPDQPPTPANPASHPTGCTDCTAGFCICVGGVYLLDPPLALPHESTPQPLLVSAQLSIPESSSLERIFHPPRA